MQRLVITLLACAVATVGYTQSQLHRVECAAVAGL